MFSVDQIKNYIEAQTGLSLSPCDFFSGLQLHNGETYFNFLLSERYSESREVFNLERLAKNSAFVYRIEPNGMSRVAIFFH